MVEMIEVDKRGLLLCQYDTKAECNYSKNRPKRFHYPLPPFVFKNCFIRLLSGRAGIAPCLVAVNAPAALASRQIEASSPSGNSLMVLWLCTIPCNRAAKNPSPQPVVSAAFTENPFINPECC